MENAAGVIAKLSKEQKRDVFLYHVSQPARSAPTGGTHREAGVGGMRAKGGAMGMVGSMVGGEGRHNRVGCLVQAVCQWHSRVP